MARKIAKIYWHCSASEFGDREEIDRWHKQRGWSGIGYHYVIQNGFPKWAHWKDRRRVPELIGVIQDGRTLNDDNILEAHEIGAHVKGENSYSIGICIIGMTQFAQKQITAGIDLSANLCIKHGIDPSMVRGHSEVWTDKGQEPKKTCPNMDMNPIRVAIRSMIVVKSI